MKEARMKRVPTQEPGRKFRLGSRLDVYALLLEYFDVYVELMAEIIRKAPQESVPVAQMAEQEAVLAGFLTEIFTGRNTTRTIPVPGWNGEGLGRALRMKFALQLLRLSESDAELFAEDGEVVHFGMIELVREMQKLAWKCAGQGGEHLERQGREVHELCARWSALLSNSSDPLPMQEARKEPRAG